MGDMGDPWVFGKQGVFLGVFLGGYILGCSFLRGGTVMTAVSSDYVFHLLPGRMAGWLLDVGGPQALL